MTTDKPTPSGFGDPRTQLAAERTLLAWVRTGLALMGFGFVVARFGLFLRELATMQPAAQIAAPAKHVPEQHSLGLSLWAGVTLIVLGVAVNILAAARHWQTVGRLNRDEPLAFRPLSMGVLLAAALGIMGIIIATYLLVGLQPSGRPRRHSIRAARRESLATNCEPPFTTSSLLDHTMASISNHPSGSPFVGDPYHRLFRRTVAVLIVVVIAIVLTYYFVDRTVAFFVHDQHIAGRVIVLGGYEIPIFKWLTYPPPILQTLSPLVFAALMVRRLWGSLAHWQKTLLVACLSVMVANEFRQSIGDVCGRYWPDTWFNADPKRLGPNNPSLIGTGTYGFHWFDLSVGGGDIGSFPSGHSARILGFVTVWWIAVPRSRALCAILAPPMLIGLVAMNYHFVSDVIAGSVLGGIVGAYAARMGRLDSAQWSLAAAKRNRAQSTSQ